MQTNPTAAPPHRSPEAKEIAYRVNRLPAEAQRRIFATAEAKPSVDELMLTAFSRPRDPRSPEYKAGARAALEFRLNKVPIRCPYDPATAASDAFHAGTHEGHRLAREVPQR